MARSTWSSNSTKRTSSTSRARGRKAIIAVAEPSETQQLISLIKMLEDFARPDVFWHHSPNEGQRTKAEKCKLTAMGTRWGFQDILLIKGGMAYLMEFKTSIGRLSKEQKDTMASTKRAGAITAVAYGLDAAIEILNAWDMFRTPISTGLGRSPAREIYTAMAA